MKDIPALTELRESLLTALVVEDWQRRCDASLVASFNKRELERKRPPVRDLLLAALLFALAVLVGVMSGLGKVHPAAGAVVFVVYIVIAAHLGRPR